MILLINYAPHQLMEEMFQMSLKIQQRIAPRGVPRFLIATRSALTRLRLRGPSVSPTPVEFWNPSTLKELWDQIKGVKYLLGVQKVVVDY